MPNEGYTGTLRTAKGIYSWPVLGYLACLLNHDVAACSSSLYDGSDLIVTCPICDRILHEGTEDHTEQLPKYLQRRIKRWTSQLWER